MNRALIISIILLGISLHVSGGTVVSNLRFKDFKLRDNYIFGIDFSNIYFQIANLSTPTNPVLINTLSLQHRPFRIAVYGNYVYILQASDGSSEQAKVIDSTYSYGYFTIIDITYLNSPIIKYVSPNYIYSVHSLAVAGNMLFVAADNLYVYDVSISYQPQLKVTLNVTYPGEIVAKYVDNSNSIVIAIQGSSIVSYNVYVDQNRYYYYTLGAYIYINARSLFLSGERLFVVDDYSVYTYTVQSTAIYLETSHNYLLANQANSIIYDNITNLEYINFRATNSILEYNSISDTEFCSYDVGFITDVMAYSDPYIYANLMQGGLLITNKHNETCVLPPKYSMAIGVLVGIILGVLAFIIVVICIICVWAKQYRKIKRMSYQRIDTPPIQPYTQVSPSNQFYQNQFYPPQNVYAATIISNPPPY